MTGTSLRSQREIIHSRNLALGDTERIWGWGTPAGRRRARRRAALVAAGAGLAPGTRSLEIGCGTGMFTEIFARTGAHIVAVDLSPELLAKAATRDVPSDRVRFVRSRFEDGDVVGPFDAVIGSSVLHHLEIGPALKTIHRLLKPGGHLAFAEPNYLNPQIFITYKFRSFFPHISPDEDAFYRWRLRRRLERAGFDSISITPFDWLHPRTPRVLMDPVASAGRVLERLPGIREFAGSLLIAGRRG